VALVGAAFGTTGQSSSLWRLESIPAGSQARLTGADTATASFVADVAGPYVASFTVRDACASSAPDIVTLLVPGPICLTAAPLADPGPNQQATRGFTVTVSGQASHSSGSGVLGYRWSMDSRPAGSTATLATPTSVSTTFLPDRRGDYVLSLVVNDGCQESLPATVTVTLPNTPPSVYLGYIWQATALLPMSLYASVSDPDGDPVTYAWSLLTRPAGSAAMLSDSAATSPTFTPDVAGSYTFQLAVSDGMATTTTSGTFSAIDYPPVASAGIDRAVPVGASATLDASASSDANQTPLTFAWVLRGPAGSAAALSRADTAMPTFVPDVPGSYRATVTVSSGGLSATATVNVAAWPAVERLTHRIIDAAYSGALDRIVMVAADPAALYLLDPATGVETQVALTLAPSALALSPDGLSAVVGHAGAVTSIDLSAGTAEPPVVVSFDVAGLVLGGGRVAWAVPRVLSSSERAHLVAVSLDGAPEASVATGFLGPSRVRLRPGTTDLYLAGVGTSGYSATVEHYTVSGVTPVLATALGGYSYSSCGDLWFSQAGTRLFTSCGPIYLASSSWTEDLTSAGALTSSAGYGFQARHLSDSTAAGTLSAITTPDGYYGSGSDSTLRRWSAADLTQLEVALLPSELVHATSYRWGGRYVFYRSDGSARYVLLQLDPASGVLQDFGWVTY
jgi:hypothetical protein